MELYTVAQVRQVERRAVEEFGMSQLELVENAAKAVVEEVRALPIPGPRARHRYTDKLGREATPEEVAEFWAMRQRSALVLCGPGSNGADGMAVARMLLEVGWRVKCGLVGGREKMTDTCREMERRFLEAGGEVEENPARLMRWGRQFDVAIDAMYGIGLNRELDGDTVEVINHMGGSWVVAVDVPTGIHADTGEGMSPGMVVSADVTVTFIAAKPGLFLDLGGEFSGRVVVADLGIPDGAYRTGEDGEEPRFDQKQVFVTEQERLGAPYRSPFGHKGDFGKLFILAGSRGYTGAAALCAKAAARSGVGLVTLAVPEDIYPIVAAKCCDEVMVQPWGTDDEVVERARAASAAVIGPGLGQGERAQRLVLRLMGELAGPIILDADGLNIISRHIHVLDEREGPTVLTPHDGEFARLCGRTAPVRDRLGAARAFAHGHRCVVVLKGHRTITAFEDGAAYINPTGNSGMAKGGSGDALAGLAGGLAAQAMAPYPPGQARERGVSPLLAVWLHGRAGDLAAADKGEHGMTPSDLIEQIPYAMKELN